MELKVSQSPVNPNVLAERYASAAMQKIWSQEEKIRLERRFWISVMRAESKYGVKISPEEISQYESALETVDLESIDKRERKLRHDVKARIEEFNSLAGLQLIHLGMTSRDLTENVEMVQVRDSLRLIRAEVVGVLHTLAEKMQTHINLVIVGRSHNVPAQLTTFGKRLATIAEELLFAFERLESLLQRLPLRGVRGPVGTAQDLHDLVGDAANAIEVELAQELGFNRVLDSTGQIYPRSIDFEVISTLVQLAAAPSNFATTVRLMSGAGLMTEGFKEGQVGSSAMPHKMNARSSERINGLSVVLKGYLSMISEISGDQWNEGDVSCSVVRRVALPDAFFALDGVLQTFATVLREMKLFSEEILREVTAVLPLVATTSLLTEAVKKGLGREEAHAIIQKHSLTSIEKSRVGMKSTFIDDLGNDTRFPLDVNQIHSLVEAAQQGSEVAKVQTRMVLGRISSTFGSNSLDVHTWSDIR
jgi:adenylosuccinate lyase